MLSGNNISGFVFSGNYSPCPYSLLKSLSEDICSSGVMLLYLSSAVATVDNGKKKSGDLTLNFKASGSPV